MAAIIALMISIGVIFSAEEATPELAEQYEQEYYENVVIDDVDGM